MIGGTALKNLKKMPVFVLSCLLFVPGCTPPAQNLLAILDRPASGEDSIPENEKLLDIAESRLLGRTDNATLWVAINKNRMYCLVISQDNAAVQKANSSCVSEDSFRRSGVTTDANGTSYWLLPDAKKEEAIPAGWKSTLDNLLIRD